MSYIKVIGNDIQVFGEVKPDEDAINENIINRRLSNLFKS